MPMTFAPTAENASDFSNLRQNGLIRIVFSAAATDQANESGDEPGVQRNVEVDVWRMVPTVNDVKLTGDDGENAWPRGSNSTGGYQLDARFGHPPGAGACRTARPTPRFKICLPDQMLDNLAAFQQVLFTNNRVRQALG